MLRCFENHAENTEWAEPTLREGLERERERAEFLEAMLEAARRF